MKQMTFSEAIKSVFHNYANFSGRARRSEFWWFALLTYIIIPGVMKVIQLLSVLPLIFSAAAAGSEAATYTDIATYGGALIVNFILVLAASVIGLVLLIPSISVAVRRLHDTGRSGWLVLIGLIPLIGTIIHLIWFCGDSQPGANKWGNNPKE